MTCLRTLLKTLPVIALGVLTVSSCTLVHDLDELQEGLNVDTETVDTDTTDDCTVATDCDDAINCTADSCLETGNCQHLPLSSLCADLEKCDILLGCVPIEGECTNASHCDDGIDCTQDSCSQGECYNVGYDSLCEEPCYANAVCDHEQGCIGGTLIVCDQPDEPCLYAACNEETGLCEDQFLEGFDDDNDTFLDISCGGDDCNDNDPAINPNASEPCDYVDNDCDGYTDVSTLISPLAVSSGQAISTPRVASNGTSHVVVWQTWEVTQNLIYLRLVNSDGTMTSDPINITGLAGANTTGENPSIVSRNDGFYVLWTSRSADLSRSLWLQDMVLGDTDGEISPGAGLSIAGAAGDSFAAADVIWDEGQGEWVAAYARVNSGQTHIEVKSETTVASALVVSSGPGSVESVSLASLGAGSYDLTYARDDGGNPPSLEVYEAKFSKVGATLVLDANYPKMISENQATWQDDSFHPIVSTSGVGAPITAFSEAFEWVDGSTINLWVWDGTTLREIINNSDYEQRDHGWTFSSNRFGLMYVNDWNFGRSVEFELFGPDLSTITNPYVGTRFAIIESQDGEISECRLAPSGDNFAASWLQKKPGVIFEEIVFTVFERCGL